MGKVVRPVVGLILMVSVWIALGAGTARAQTDDSAPAGDESVVIVIDGVEFVLEDGPLIAPGVVTMNPLDSLPPGFVALGVDEIPADFLATVPPEYMFFVDPTLPLPPEFQFLDDPTLPVPPQYMFLFDPTLPVPDEFAWLFGPVPVGVASQTVVSPVTTNAPEPEAEPEPDPITEEPAPEAEQTAAAAGVDTDASTDDEAAAPYAADVEDLPVDEPEEANTSIAPAAEPEAFDSAPEPSADATSLVTTTMPVAATDQTSSLLVPLLVFVAITSVALLATVPLFLRKRSTSETALRELALTDDLTKLANRRRLDRDLRTHQKEQNDIAVAMIDIDHFKRLNDNFGHAAGDVVLQSIAATISQNVRSSDVAYRYGGEEFCVLLPGATELEAAAVVDRVRGVVQNLAFDFLDRNVTISVGVAIARSDGSDTTGMGTIERADAALYAAKDSGRNRVMLSSLMSTTSSSD